MKNKQLTSQRLSLALATGLFSAGLLLSGCSNSDNAETDVKTEGTEATDAQETTDTLTATEADDILESEGVQITDSVEDKNKTSIASDDINPLTAAVNQQSLVTNPTEAGTPEDTVKQALNALYYGDVKDAVVYYRVDMENFEEELANTQSAFQQTVESVTITKTQYSVDRIRATITGELKLKGQSEPAPLTYQLRKVGPDWKILG